MNSDVHFCPFFEREVFVVELSDASREIEAMQQEIARFGRSL